MSKLLKHGTSLLPLKSRMKTRGFGTERWVFEQIFDRSEAGRESLAYLSFYRLLLLCSKIVSQKILHHSKLRRYPVQEGKSKPNGKKLDSNAEIWVDWEKVAYWQFEFFLHFTSKTLLFVQYNCICSCFECIFDSKTRNLPNSSEPIKTQDKNQVDLQQETRRLPDDSESYQIK